MFVSILLFLASLTLFSCYRSRRSSAGSGRGDSSVQSSLELPASSLASSLSSDGGFSEK